MPDLNLQIQTADRSRKAEIVVPIDLTVGELLEEAQRQWQLPATVDYAVRCDRTGQQLTLKGTLGASGVLPGDVIEIVPLLEAGARDDSSRNSLGV